MRSGIVGAPRLEPEGNDSARARPTCSDHLLARIPASRART
ncbi:hypothetical protein [Albidovulum sp.]